jgi:ABC-type phosphonate transport system ATPase subunit
MHLKARRRPAMRQLPVFSEETAMDEYSVDVLPGEVLAWVREDAGRKSPRLWVRCEKLLDRRGFAR